MLPYGESRSTAPIDANLEKELCFYSEEVRALKGQVKFHLTLKCPDLF
ncbi:MAG: hypothetical protein JWQ35_1314, partial [Bacteriovoracaceae bacterium]|nr:hypothetical protein [Bacteriovoracaceae bacterium]